MADKCLYNDQDCSSELWECKGCGKKFCAVHYHETALGHSVECATCEQIRISTGKVSPGISALLPTATHNNQPAPVCPKCLHAYPSGDDHVCEATVELERRDLDAHAAREAARGNSMKLSEIIYD